MVLPSWLLGWQARTAGRPSNRRTLTGRCAAVSLRTGLWGCGCLALSAMAGPDEAGWTLPATPPRTWVLPAEREAFRSFALEGEGAAFFAAIKQEFDVDYLNRPFPDEPVHFGDPDPTKRTSEKVDLWRDGHWRGANLAGIAQAAALIWRVNGEDPYLQRAREATLHMVSWDVNGTSGVNYNDEVHYRLWRVFPMVYDQLRDTFSPDERQHILASFRERGARSLENILTNQTAELRRNSLAVEPASHPVRFMAMTGMAGLALLDDLPEARGWWEFAQRFYRDQFPPWGGDDGGWAEGPGYWRAVITHALFQDALAALEHPDAWQNLFWRNTGYYGVYFVPPERSTMFCDLSGRGSFGMEPGVHHFMRCQARIAQDGFFQSYAAQFPVDVRPLELGGLQIKKNPPNGVDYFLRSFRASRRPVPEPAPLGQLPYARHFRDIGWVSMHSDLGSFTNDIAVSFKSSPYGSYSHSHGDQNAMILRAFGEDLAINSGYREYHRSPHHVGWTRQTRSKNAVLIQGEGQAVQDKHATGDIIRFETGDRYAWTTGDATPAYRANPALEHVVQRVVRDVVLIDKRYVVTRDHVTLQGPGTLSWLLHAQRKMDWDPAAQRVRIHQGEALLEVQLLSVSNRLSATQAGEFAVPVDPKYLSKGYTDQFHLTAVTDHAAGEHRVYSVLWPARVSDESVNLSLTMGEKGWLRVERPDGPVDRILLDDDQFQLSTPEPATLLMSGPVLAETARRLRAGDAALRPALSNVLHQAELAMGVGPFSVTHKTMSPPSGDPHDYMSFGRYWWPDPSRPDGLPYIQRDGETNPDSQGAGSDRPRLGALGDAVETLTLAYYFTGEERFAERTALLLRTWFVDPQTRMNPNLNFAQGIPGRVAGRKTGVLDGRLFCQVLDGVALLSASPSLTAADHEALRAWFAEYLDWLKTHENARGESESRNNHGTFFDVQIAHVALSVGDRAFAKNVLKTAIEKRILAHIQPDGSQPEELARTRPLHYCLFNLEAMFQLARLGEHVGVDLWQAGDARIRAGLDFLAPYADPAVAWPVPTINEAARVRLLPLLLHGADVYGDERYLQQVAKLPVEETAGAREQLVVPLMR